MSDLSNYRPRLTSDSEWQWGNRSPSYDCLRDYITPTSVLDRCHEFTDDQTRRKTVAFEFDGDRQTETSPKILAATNDISLDLRPTYSSVAFPASNRGAVTARATERPCRPLPSPPHTLQTENSTTVSEPGYSQLNFDFRSTDNQGDGQGYCIPNYRRHSEGMHLYRYVGLCRITNPQF